jgi:hypothetical protein
MNFNEEPEWMKKARTIPLYSTPDGRKEHARLRDGHGRGNNRPKGNRKPR